MVGGPSTPAESWGGCFLSGLSVAIVDGVSCAHEKCDAEQVADVQSREDDSGLNHH